MARNPSPELEALREIATQLAEIKALLAAPPDRPPTLDDFGDVLTTHDLARLLQVPPRHFERARAADRMGLGYRLMPKALPGRRPRYRKADVRAWLEHGPDLSVSTAAVRRRNSGRGALRHVQQSAAGNGSAATQEC